MQNHYDVIVVGAGPAGVSAALTLRARNKSVLMCYSDLGALKTAHRVDNYPGMPAVSGEEMLRAFHRQCEDAGVTLYPHAVRQMLPMGDTVSVMAGESLFTASCAVLCVGVVRKSRIPGEQDYVGRGVSYCATCDGMFYRGKKIAVISAYHEGVEECNFLSSLAAETCYFSEKKHDTAGIDPRVQVMENRVTEIKGDGVRVTHVLCGGEAVPVDGVFILRPATPPDQMIPGLKVENGAILVDSGYKTNLDRIFAAGDCIGTPYQVATAVGHGNAAALAAVACLDQQ